MVAAVVLVLLFAGPVAFLAKEIATNEVGRQLYAGWYVPFLGLATLAYVVFLLAGSSTARRR